MKLLVHQAIYGEQNRGHSLLARSTGNEALFSELVGLTDLPGTSGTSTDWEPYISCFAVKEHLILSKTFPDLTSSRPGMVLTHVLAIDLYQAAQLLDLQPLLALFPSFPERKNSLSTIELEVRDDSDVNLQDTSHSTVPGLTKLMDVLIRKRDWNRPVVWIGQDGFTEVVKSLWRTLWPEARKRLSFRLSFGPQDVEGQQDLTLVVTPTSMEYRWGGYVTVRSTDVHKPTTLAEAFLLGRPEGDALRDLLANLSGRLFWITDLIKLEKCYELIRLMSASTSADEVRLLTRLLGELSPNPGTGNTIKSAALNKLVELTEKGTASDVKSLRNFSTLPFSDGDRLITGAIQAWVKSKFQSALKNTAQDDAALIALAFSSPESTWSNAIRDTTNEVLAHWGKGIGQRVWWWWHEAPSLVTTFANHLPNRHSVETELVDKCPHQLPITVGERVVKLAEEKGWYVLHAVALSAYCDPETVFARQLRIDRDTKYVDGLRALSERLPPESVINAALNTSDKRLIYLAGEACARQPTLLVALNVDEPTWRAVWLNSIKISNNTWAGIDNPKHSVEGLLDIVLRGEKIDDELLLHIAPSAYGDLTNYPRRREIWAKLTPEVATAFLHTTANGWLQNFISDSAFDMAVEKPLEDHVLDPSILEKYLAPQKPGAVSLGLKVFERFPALPQHRFEHWLRSITNVVHQVDVADSMLLGKLVNSKRWRGVASMLFKLVLHYNRNDLVPALIECEHLLDWFDGIRFRWSGKSSHHRISWDDWWFAFTETAIELYPRGPEDLKIWERSGGDLALVQTNQPGRAAWQHAIRKLKNGGGGKDINTTRLLHNMSVDFPRKDKLELLQQMWRRLGGKL